VYRAFGQGSINTFLYYLRCMIHALFHRYDLVFLHHGESGYITPLLRIRYRVVVTFHGVLAQDDPKFSRLHNLFFRFSEWLNVKTASEVISVSKHDAGYIREKYGREVLYIPNGINLNNRTIVRPERNSPYILFAAGRIYQIKGLHLLLQALHSLQTGMPLLVAGKVEELREYTREIESLSEGLNVEFLGLITEKPRLLGLTAGAELFIFPSLTEAMSMMLLEAVSTGVPVIASDIPSNTAIFGDDEVLYFKSGDQIDLGEKLRFAMENMPLMRQRARKAAAHLAGHYTAQRVGEQYDQVFDRLL
jgi:glycosyltransferase involved in cell wall biosynthesis